MTTSPIDETIQAITGPGELPMVELTNDHGSARISLLGATLIDWTPAGELPVIWLSRQAVFEPGRGIRGGVPICWPWFGAHPQVADYPSHGFARTQLWDFVGAEQLEDGRSRATFALPLSPQAMWPHDTALQYTVTLGETLELELVTRNLSDSAFTITQALHTYFYVGDIEQLDVYGLDGKHYLDKPDAYAEKQQQGAITFEGEVDRIYFDTADECIIDDPAHNREICINKQGSNSTVVWNPWEQNAAEMSDMVADGYRTMVCVETCNAASDAVTLEPGASTRLFASYSIKQ